MKKSERALLKAVRNSIRNNLGYNPTQCTIEPDENIPAIADDIHIAVIPGAQGRGRRHGTSGTVNDITYGCNVVVFMRATHIARDRLREAYLENLSQLNDRIDQIYDLIDYNYTLLTAANAIIVAETGSTEGFVEPLKFASQSQPKPTSPETFAAKGSISAGLQRSIAFDSARRLTTKAHAL